MLSLSLAPFPFPETYNDFMRSPDIVVAGAGIIGMACALELEGRGLRVTVLERGLAGQEASWAAAGMLAAHDPANPAALRPLSELSLSLYPGFLEFLQQVGGLAVPFETRWTLEQAAEAAASSGLLGLIGFHRIAEQSINPRTLMAAVQAAVRQSSIVLHEGTPAESFKAVGNGVEVSTKSGTIHSSIFLDCTGAWSTAPIRPAKGQMLRLHAPGALAVGELGSVVVRTPDIYLVPRLDGSVVVGATVEDAGFDKTLREADLLHLRREAACLIEALFHAPALESWAGLRPGTPDHLPLIGSTGPGTFVAAGHFRNGILLAPGTANVVADALLNEATGVGLDAFAPDRFSRGESQAANLQERYSRRRNDNRTTLPL